LAEAYPGRPFGSINSGWNTGWKYFPPIGKKPSVWAQDLLEKRKQDDDKKCYFSKLRVLPDRMYLPRKFASETTPPFEYKALPPRK